MAGSCCEEHEYHAGNWGALVENDEASRADEGYCPSDSDCPV